MEHKKDYEGPLGRLRNKAERGLQERLREEADVSTLAPEEIQRLVHELHVHQIELELQNEELRSSQLKLAESRDRYSDLYDFAPTGYFTLDEHGEILEVNLSGSSMLGNERASLSRKPLSIFIAREDQAVFFSHLKRVVRTQNKHTCEIAMLRNGDSEFYARLESVPVFDHDGKLTAFRCIVSDITELKRAQRELQEAHDKLEDRVRQATAKLAATNSELVREIDKRKQKEDDLTASEQRFRAVFESASDGFFLSDTSLQYTHVNAAARKLFGVRPSKIVGRTPLQLLGEDLGKEITDLSLRALEGETVEREVTRKVRGEPLTLQETFVPLRGPRDDITGICSVLRDITERKAAVVPPPVTPQEYPSVAMRTTLSHTRVAANSQAMILLQGESGSGKDHLARWIHQHSPNASGPYFALNCAALPGEIADSELFGHEKGAFTGAWRRKKGLLELAEGGTLLLNEIGELPLSLQSKILTFLDTKSFTRVGGEKHILVNARLIAASHRDLQRLVETGEFLEPLFHRLNVFPIVVPSLRERREDLPLLIEEISSGLATEMQLGFVPKIDQASFRAMKQYPWPGNIRELRNVLERAMILLHGETMEVELPGVDEPETEWSYTVRFEDSVTLNDVREDLTQSFCCEALRRVGGSKTKAAAMLGISRDALYRYLRRVDDDCASPTDD